jgi:hypothetical protein
MEVIFSFRSWMFYTRKKSQIYLLNSNLDGPQIRSAPLIKKSSFAFLNYVFVPNELKEIFHIWKVRDFAYAHHKNVQLPDVLQTARFH